MSDDVKPVAPEDVGQAEDVAGKVVEPIGLRAFGFAAQVVAALVGRDDAKTLRRERLEILAPAEPELGKSVQEHDERTLVRPRLGAVQRDAVGRDEAETEWRGPSSMISIPMRPRYAQCNAISAPLRSACPERDRSARLT